jgi:hypothetical protein
VPFHGHLVAEDGGIRSGERVIGEWLFDVVGQMGLLKVAAGQY